MIDFYPQWFKMKLCTEKDSLDGKESAIRLNICISNDYLRRQKENKINRHFGVQTVYRQRTIQTIKFEWIMLDHGSFLRFKRRSIRETFLPGNQDLNLVV